MIIPSRNIGPWAKNVVDACYASLKERSERGTRYRNLYLTGSFDGQQAIYNKTYEHIENLSSWLFSPVDLRYGVDFYGSPSPADRAMGREATRQVHRYMRRGGVRLTQGDAVTWGLVKGASLIKLLFDRKGLCANLIQPEMFGVLEEDKIDLDAQDAFVHSSYYTPDRFSNLMSNRPDKAKIMRQVGKYMNPATDRDSPMSDTGGQGMQIVVPSTQPFTAAGTPMVQGRGTADWMSAPMAMLDPRIVRQMIRIDELWVRDQRTDEWVTKQLVGDILLDGEDRHRNIFADPFDPDNPDRRLPANEDNPLAGHHPFIVFRPNRLSGYFWGLSECHNLQLLQRSLNNRINGINALLRRQEDPPTGYTGGSGVTDRQHSILRKPGGYLSDASPNFKIQNLAPEIPQGLWESLHEIEARFDAMGGFTPTMRGRADQGVRSQAQVEGLAQMGSPNMKDRALVVEEASEEVGGLALDLLKAKVATRFTAWLMPGEESVVADIAAGDNEFNEAPAKGMRPHPFTFQDLPNDCSVVVDSHSSSPAFAAETKQLMFALAKIGAADPIDVIQHVHPPGEEALIAGVERREISKAQLVAEHPELAFKKGKKG